MRSLAWIWVVLVGCGHYKFDDLDGSVDSVVHAGRPRVLLIGDVGAAEVQMWLTWLMGRADQMTQVQESVVLDDTFLADQDIIVSLLFYRPYSAGEIAAIERRVADGAGLVMLNGFGSTNEVEYGNALGAPYDVRFDSQQLDTTLTEFVDHPLTAGLVQVPFVGGYALDAPSSVATVELGGMVLGAASAHGLGRVYAWGDEWVTFDSSWRATENLTWWENTVDWIWPTR